MGRSIPTSVRGLLDGDARERGRPGWAAQQGPRQPHAPTARSPEVLPKQLRSERGRIGHVCRTPLRRTSNSQLSWPPHLQREAEQDVRLLEQGGPGGKAEITILQENTCQPKAGACTRCKNYRNVMLWLHNFKKVKKHSSQYSHIVPSNSS